MHTAIYTRVSSRSQDTRSQRPDLERWAAADGTEVRWYTDTASGATMDRPGWQRLESDLRMRQVSRVVVWRLDRLGRTAAGLCALFAELEQLGVGLVSVRDGLDLATPAGRLMAHVLASVAQYEREVRSERQRAGIDAARAAGTWSPGRKQGDRWRVTDEMEREIRRMRQATPPVAVAAIARLLDVSRNTVYSVLATP